MSKTKEHWAEQVVGPRPASIVVLGLPRELAVHSRMTWMGGTMWVVEFVDGKNPGPWILANVGTTWCGNPRARMGSVEQLTVVLEDPEGSGR